MKIGCFETSGVARLGAFEDGFAVDLNAAYADLLRSRGALDATRQADVELPSSLLAMIERSALPRARAALDHARTLGLTSCPFAHPVAEVRFRAPLRPPKLICVGGNYEDYRKLIGLPPSPVPLMFLKSPAAVIGHGEAVKIPDGYGIFYHEWEFSCVMAKPCRGIRPDQVNEHIFGYTIVNDITGRSLEATERELQPLGKNMDTFAPMGPWIVTRDAMPANLYGLRTIRRRNGKVECESNTSNMRRTFEEIVAYVANFMTLEAGDVITTATPPSGPFYPGDVIEAEIEGIGVLRNPVEGIAIDVQYARDIQLKDIV
jgi:acylpyruvate hydrolase